MHYYKNYGEYRWPEDISIQSAVYESSIYSLEDTLKNNEKVFVLHTWDDPLTSERTVSDLKNMMPDERVFLFKYGGHVGIMKDPGFWKVIDNLSKPEVQTAELN
jgi:hypothetical protein